MGAGRRRAAVGEPARPCDRRARAWPRQPRAQRARGPGSEGREDLCRSLPRNARPARDRAPLVRPSLVEPGQEDCTRDRRRNDDAGSRSEPDLHVGAKGRGQWDLQIFVTLAYAFDDFLDEHDQPSRQIVEEAAALLSRPRPRTWITLRAVDERSPLTRRYRDDAFRVDVTDLPIDARLGSDIDRWNPGRAALMGPTAGRVRLRRRRAAVRRRGPRAGVQAPDPARA